ncbi:MAG: PQQ-dependent sugar dehydrogenase [Verrucomicrobiota bacterium]
MRPTLDKFLTSPPVLVPGTTMPISVSNAQDRADIIAYLATLKFPAEVSNPAPPVRPSLRKATRATGATTSPARCHHITVADLPEPFATSSAGNGPARRPDAAGCRARRAAGFTVKLFTDHLNNPRVVRIAPNGDIFVAETGALRLRVLRAADGADAPLDQRDLRRRSRPPPSASRSTRRARIRNGSTSPTTIPSCALPIATATSWARGEPQVIVPKLTDSHGGHSTRDVAFSPATAGACSSPSAPAPTSRRTCPRRRPTRSRPGKPRTASAPPGTTKSTAPTSSSPDPEGKKPLHTFATGIRNGVGIAVNPITGDLWTSTNERDGLGDNLVPDYVSRVKEGGFYGWPWYYMGNHEDPRKQGRSARPWRARPSCPTCSSRPIPPRWR